MRKYICFGVFAPVLALSLFLAFGCLPIQAASGNGYLLESVQLQENSGFGFLNFGKTMVRMAIDKGIEPNLIVMLLLLPLVATLVSVLHYVFGLSGYGIFMPTMIAVTFLATGIIGGLLLFAMILMISIFGGLALRKLKLHFWPARSINLLLISVGTFGLMLISSSVQIIDISNISIFPVLFMIMLCEEFVRTQLVKSRNEAQRLAVGTLVLAIIGAVTMNVPEVQRLVILNPEWVILIVLVVNLGVGNYTGIRLSEVKRFKKAIRKKNV
ncbi:MAG: 7TM domain-containing protein [Candidatus Shapirobacteria bacterium]|jgi:hypothetical protein